MQGKLSQSSELNVCTHLQGEKETSVTQAKQALALKSLLTTERDKVLPQSHLIPILGFNCSGRAGGGMTLTSFSEAHPARMALLCSQAVPHQHWQGSTSKLHSCCGPSPHRPHRKHYSDPPSSLPIFPPPARHTQEALLSCSSPLCLQTSGKNICWQSQSNSGSPAFPIHVKRHVLKCLLRCLRYV